MDTKSPVSTVPETVIIEQRRHWINVAPVLLSTTLLLLALPAGSYLYSQHVDALNKVVPAPMMASLAGIYLLLVAAIAFLSLWIYRQNRIVLTNHHIAQYTQRGIFDHTVAQFSLIKLQDVEAEQKGLLANLLGYGSINIETAGEEENFSFRQVPHPQDLANQIMQAHEALADSATAQVNSV